MAGVPVSPAVVGVTTVVDQLQTVVPPNATYYDGMAMLQRAGKVGKVQASALGTAPPATTTIGHPDAAPTLLDKGHYGVAQWSGSLWEEVLSVAPRVNVGAVWQRSVSALQMAERRD